MATAKSIFFSKSGMSSSRASEKTINYRVGSGMSSPTTSEKPSSGSSTCLSPVASSSEGRPSSCEFTAPDNLEGGAEEDNLEEDEIPQHILSLAHKQQTEKKHDYKELEEAACELNNLKKQARIQKQMHSQLEMQARIEEHDFLKTISERRSEILSRFGTGSLRASKEKKSNDLSDAVARIAPVNVIVKPLQKIKHTDPKKVR